MTLATQRTSLLEQAKAIAERAKSSGRNLTSAEMGTIREKVAAADDIKGKMTEANESDKLFDQVMGLNGGTHHNPGGVDGPVFLDYGPTGRKRMGDQAAQTMTGWADGRKAFLPTGETGLTVPVQPADPVPLGQAPHNLLSVIPTQPVEGGSKARYLRQGTRTNNAAAVAPGAAKPVSVYGLSPVDVRLRVYATLSEGIDRFVIEDAESLARFLASELAYSVTSAVEKDVINGATGGENIVGMLGTSGIRTTAWSTDLLTTLRQAVTDLTSTGYTDLVYALSAADWQAAELTKASTSGVFQVPSAPVDQAKQTLWGQPVVIVGGLPAGTAVLFSRTAVLLYTDKAGLRVDWGSPNDQWTKNLITARCEGRFDLGILQPPGITKITTTGA